MGGKLYPTGLESIKITKLYVFMHLNTHSILYPFDLRLSGSVHVYRRRCVKCTCTLKLRNHAIDPLCVAVVINKLDLQKVYIVCN